METTYACAGICYDLYYFPFTDISIGPPTFTCLRYLDYEFTDLSGSFGKYARLYYITATLIFVSWFLQFGLCFRKNETVKTRIARI